MILFRYIGLRALAAFLGSLFAVVLLFLVVDFAENATLFRGEGWIRAALELYLNKGAVVAYQTAPAAMLFAAAVTASGLRHTREYTAMRALGLGPWRVMFPVMAVAAVIALTFSLFDDAIVVDAHRRVEDIMVKHFRRYGSWKRWHEQKRWFRGRDGHRIFNLHQALPDGSFRGVTILEVTDDFRLVRRLDADVMTPGAVAGDWHLANATERRFDGEGRIAFEKSPEKLYHFDEDPKAFKVLPGRPSQLRRGALISQIRLRRQLGLPTADFELEWQNKLAYPIAGFAAGLVALSLSLRRNRKGHLTVAVVESVAISLLFWIAQAVSWSLGLSGRISPEVAAWAPNIVFVTFGAAGLRLYA